MQNRTIQTNRTSRRQSGVIPLCISTSAGFLIFGIVEMDVKKCSKCEETKNLSKFNIRPDRRSGYRSECKKCQYKKYAERARLQRYKIRANKNARTATGNGTLIRPDYCQGCGQNKPLDMHHPNYEKQLEVIWLCHKCHTVLHFGKKVLQCRGNGEVIRGFNSIAEAENITGILNGNISSVCNGKRKTAGGFTWQHAKNL